MFWYVLLTITLLASLASGWMTVRKSDGRVIISLETHKARQAVVELCARGKNLFEHVRH